MASAIMNLFHRSCPFTGLSHCFCPEGTLPATTDESVSFHKAGTNKMSEYDFNQDPVRYSKSPQDGLEPFKYTPFKRPYSDTSPLNLTAAPIDTSIKHSLASHWLQSFGYSSKDASSLFDLQAKMNKTPEVSLNMEKKEQSQFNPLLLECANGNSISFHDTQRTKNKDDTLSTNLVSPLLAEDIHLYNKISNTIFQERYAYLMKTVPIEVTRSKAQPLVTSQEKAASSELPSPGASLVAPTPYLEQGDSIDESKTASCSSTAVTLEEAECFSISSTNDLSSTMNSGSRSSTASTSTTVPSSAVSIASVNEDSKLSSEIRKQSIKDEEHFKNVSEKYGAPVLLAGEPDDEDLRIELICHVRSCKNETDKKELLLCIKCRRSFHAKCCSPPLKYELVTRHTWSCNECKACKICGSNTNEETMLICDACDRAFHMECLTPPVHEVPEGEWFCSECGQCHCCDRIFTRQEALDPNGFFNGRYRLCITCRDKYGRRPSSKRLKSSNKAGVDEINELCGVCVKRLTNVDRGDLKSVIKCRICYQAVHKACTYVDNNSKETFICKACHEFQKGFGMVSSL